MNTRQRGTAAGRRGGLVVMLAAVGLLLAGCALGPGVPGRQEAAVADRAPWLPSGGVTVPGVVLDGAAVLASGGCGTGDGQICCTDPGCRQADDRTPQPGMRSAGRGGSPRGSTPLDPRHGGRE
jgi:hypothetical protein